MGWELLDEMRKRVAAMLGRSSYEDMGAAQGTLSAIETIEEALDFQDDLDAEAAWEDCSEDLEDREVNAWAVADRATTRRRAWAAIRFMLLRHHGLWTAEEINAACKLHAAKLPTIGPSGINTWPDGRAVGVTFKAEGYSQTMNLTPGAALKLAGELQGVVDWVMRVHGSMTDARP